MLNKHSCRGALFIEYALILALIVGVGTAYLSSNGLSGNITNIFSKVDSTLASATSAEKSVAEKNFDFVKTLMAYIKEGDGKSDKAITGYDTDNRATHDLSLATDSDGYGLNKACFGLRWSQNEAMGKEGYDKLVGNISYAFYANEKTDGLWNVYVYNPEYNDNKKLSERTSGEKISTQVYTYDSNTKAISNPKTEIRTAKKHTNGYMVIR